MDRPILEREPELARLAAAAREAADGAGSVVLVLGEAGIGKSSLVKALPEHLPHGTRVLVGECDDLATRRPLGPFRDLIGSVGDALADAVTEGGDRHRVHEALLEELRGAVLVVEDVHWADEASLDALRFLVRRMERLPALLVLTYRDDELSREHPLRHLLGQVSRAPRVHRLPLARLSLDAVRTLSAGRVDPAQVYAVTGGNPFFVAEILAAGGTGRVPPTVVDAVLARLRGLPGATVDALEQLAVVPSAVERPLVDALLGDPHFGDLSLGGQPLGGPSLGDAPLGGSAPAREAAVGDGGPREAAVQQGGPREATTQEGGPREAATQEGDPSEATMQQGGPRESTARQGASREAAARQDDPRESTAQQGASRQPAAQQDGPREPAADPHAPREAGLSVAAAVGQRGPLPRGTSVPAAVGQHGPLPPGVPVPTAVGPHAPPPGGVAVLAAAEQRGLLAVTPERVAFRHELIRRAVVDSLPAARRIELNRAVLAALVARPGSDAARIVHHAAQAGDQDAIARYGPDAAREASSAGAHREAAAHLQLVLRGRGRYSPSELADLLERYAVETYTIADSAAAVAAQREAVALRRALGDSLALGADLRWLSRIHWWAGNADQAQEAAREAVAVLEHAGDDRLLALAVSNTAQLRMLSERYAEAVEHGERAITLARKAGDPAILAHALNNVGTARWRSGDPGGRAQLEESLDVALAAGEVEHACRSYANIIWTLLDNLQYDEADTFLPPAMELADRAEHLGFLNYLHVELAMRRLAAADWGDAEKQAEYGMHDFIPARCPALTVLARVRTRCGRPGADELLDEAWEIAVGTKELQRTGPVAVARAEAAWLRGDMRAVVEAAAPVHAQASRLPGAPYRAELGYWLTKAGHPPPPDDSDHPYALQARGQWRRAATVWEAVGCPYEHAAALAESPDPADKLTALAAFDALGAEPAARLLRVELRRLGVRRIPRGPLAATRENPAGLTERQLQVIRLLAEGLTNAEIAARLVVSVRTVDNHVRAVLDKLGAPSRRWAAVRAAELGLLADGSQT
ncbi:AAA family ATPase [Streptomyces griseorubiginosus]|uniref:AAA family ATPase n=1 Tax=Streptomyces griseorubiginosus TaxID=67304 RepID=UPI002E801E09|nr:AAA family ATPase [Streptomyces griseorubiginosus]WUB48884.1 AAA family ATPase [Streptomyces griseorubiginosus]WUB57411.1 AAA family ATPase [Streptomyces griseorubiginosus]